MQLIKAIIEQIEDEIDGADEYITCAVKYKDDYRDIANAYAEMAQQELTHMDRLHDMVSRIIRDYRAANGEPPEAMKAVWDWEHEKAVDEATEIRMKIEQYRK